jgi:hypothetical protein
MMRGVGRREAGHSNLTMRSLKKDDARRVNIHIPFGW